MKILQIAPPWESVPPQAYGGTEAVVSLLTDGLVARGFDVTLVATGESRTSARLISTTGPAKRSSDYLYRMPRDAMHAAAALQIASQFDIVHNHAGEIVLAMSLLLEDLPMLTTMHCQVVPETLPIWQAQRGFYNTISLSQANSLPPSLGGIHLGHVYNAIEVESFPFSARRGDYLLYLSRISPEKGPDLAIEVAKRLGWPLIMAGKVDPSDQAFFEKQIAPLIDGQLVRFVGEANAQLKRELYLGARCLLMPLCWEEPFGLVMPEAMACGCPVIAMARGSAPEIVKPGVSGFLADDLDGFTNAVRRSAEISPYQCRSHVKQLFDVPRMIDEYLRLYEKILLREPSTAEAVA